MQIVEKDKSVFLLQALDWYGLPVYRKPGFGKDLNVPVGSGGKKPGRIRLAAGNQRSRRYADGSRTYRFYKLTAR